MARGAPNRAANRDSGISAENASGADQSTNSGVGLGSAERLAGRHLAVEHRPVEALVPYARNARTHSDAQVAEIAASIRAFGWTNPILVDGENGIIAGHGRLLAARKLKLGTVPVIELAGLSKAEKRAYVLADNKFALNAGWDDALLAAEVADLDGLGFDLSLAGFSDGEVGRLVDLFQQDGAPAFPDEAPPLPEHPVTRPGDLWVMGEHRLLCGDATKAEDRSHVLGGGLADMVFTDPPYNVDYRRTGHRKIANDALGGAFGSFLEEACRAMLAVTKGALYVCMSSSELDTLKRAFLAAGGHWSTFIVWAKNAFTLGRSDYQRQYEPILYGWPEGNRHFWCGARDEGDVWHSRQAGPERAPSHDEAGRPRRAGDPELVQDEGHHPRPVRRIGDHPHGCRGDRPACRSRRARPCLLRRDRPALAGRHRAERHSRGGRAQLRRGRGGAGQQ